MKIHSEDFFPQCVIIDETHPDTGLGTLYPVPKTGSGAINDFDKVMEWFRRVKVWRCQASMEFSFGIWDADFSVMLRPPSAFPPESPPPPEREDERICKLGPLLGSQLHEGAYAEVRCTIWMTSIYNEIGDGHPFDGPQCRCFNGEYFPKMRIRITGQGETPPSYYADTYLAPPGAPPANVQELDATIGGYHIKFWNAVDSLVPATGGGDRFIHSIDLSPQTWFTYANEDGSEPVWNAATGALIGDPFILPELL